MAVSFALSSPLLSSPSVGIFKYFMCFIISDVVV